MGRRRLGLVVVLAAEWRSGDAPQRILAAIQALATRHRGRILPKRAPDLVSYCSSSAPLASPSSSR